jgi:hypothetical protein
MPRLAAAPPREPADDSGPEAAAKATALAAGRGVDITAAGLLTAAGVGLTLAN